MGVGTVEEQVRQWSPIEQAYPSVARWVKEYGWIAIGQAQMTGSFVRALDEGGLVWEGETTYATVDDALRDLDAGLASWLREQLGE
jgi:hypothetical protein